MPYTDDATLIDHISELEIIALTDDEKLATGDTTVAAAVISNTDIRTRIDRAITNADITVDAWVRKQLNTPVVVTAGASTPANTPDTIRMISARLTIVNLYLRRAGEFTELPESVSAMKKGSLEMLKAINHGDIDVGLSPPPAKSSLVIAESKNEDQLFTNTTLEDF